MQHVIRDLKVSVADYSGNRRQEEHDWTHPDIHLYQPGT